jgi:YHS domain-containing protein
MPHVLCLLKNCMTRRLKLIILLFAFANAVIAQKSPVYNTKEGAIHGYDPVAYLTVGKAIKGSQAFRFNWQGATWHFANESNLRAFRNDPARYAPQYGGYCAYGLSKGYKAPIDPSAFTVVNGKLYLNYNKDVQAEWLKNKLDRIKKADQNWPSVKDRE